MLNEHLGIALKDVVDGKGKRLEVNVNVIYQGKSANTGSRGSKYARWW